MRKTTLITGASLLAVGLLLTLVGLLTNAPKTVIWNHGFQVSRHISTNEKVDKFNAIVSNSGDGEVTIKRGNNYSIKINGDEKQAPKYEVRDNILYINKQHRSPASFSGNESVTVTVPKRKTLKNVNLSLGNDAITIKDLTINKLTTTGSSDDDSGPNSLTLENTTISNSGNLELGYTKFYVTDSHLHGLTINANGNSDTTEFDSQVGENDSNDDDRSNIFISKTSLTNVKIKSDFSRLQFNDSILDNVKASANYGIVRLNSAELRNDNQFKIKRGLFRSNKSNIDGMKLNNKTGSIKYLNNIVSGHSYEAYPEAKNILRVSGDHLSINIK